jgi:hypothetical protein
MLLAIKNSVLHVNTVTSNQRARPPPCCGCGCGGCMAAAAGCGCSSCTRIIYPDHESLDGS